MKLLNRDTDYAVKDLLYITPKDTERISVSELVKALESITIESLLRENLSSQKNSVSTE